MTRQTSIDAYRAIKESGLLAKRERALYLWLYDNGPSTARKQSLKAALAKLEAVIGVSNE